ncbi:MAG TPA: choice-of-anchor tandem repeat GloVer-containing protein, partial [Steroidobacteraceae bacterium]|nr:choice-of-anchor tandem repeat GloVer-containing protein [Steroidobacteraceae bacterium]
SFAGGTSDGANPEAPLIMDSAGNLYGTTEYGGQYNYGTVFKISADGTESVLYSFAGSGTDGEYPVAGLVMDGAGDLYGTTANGGTAGEGTVFKISGGGTESVLYSFALAAGSNPAAALIIDSAGNLYGTTTAGGAHGDGTVFELSAAGTESVLYSFSGGTTDGSKPAAALVMDGAGNFYGTTESGGAYGNGAAFELSAGGAESILHSFGQGWDGISPSAPLIRDSSGNLYGTTPQSGFLGGGTVFKLAADGTETIVHSFSGTDGQNPVGGLVMDSAGNVYGTTQYGGANGEGAVFEIN